MMFCLLQHAKRVVFRHQFLPVLLLMLPSVAFRFFPLIEAFMTPTTRTRSSSRSGTIRSPLLLGERTFLFVTKQQDDNDEREEKVEVGTKEYYNGFLSSPIRQQDDTTAAQQRGDGLEQALKLGGGVVPFLMVFVLGFLASNNLI
mmetsp:Transcript_29649/g.31856  ORF Transcript_29649/g.31856 Transcript_29649/m.31856 type:complete len:145 (+) Transcript_29649:100-534(+)